MASFMLKMSMNMYFYFLGKGFCKIINPTCIIATLNGLSLETDLINPDPNPQYLTDLVWEASKNALRK